MKAKSILLAGVAMTSAFAASAHAQTDADMRDDADVIIVTGRAGAAQLSRTETSYAVTTLSAEDLRLSAPISTAEIFKDVPGFWVEASGGEASNNIRTRGIPRDGYSAVSLQEDGLPVQHDAGLGYMNADQSFRLDETIGRVEVVRGGPASVFASNAPGGIVNFITRRPGDEAEGVAKFQVGDYGLFRTDFYYGAPIGGDWELTVGGFYRSDDGVRDPGFRANEGGQFRVGLGRDLENGRIDVNLKRIDDRVAFLLPIPLTFDASGDVDEVPGFDANFGTLAGPENAFLSFRSPSGPQDFDLTEGTHTQLTQLTAVIDLDVGAGWNMTNRFRYRQSEMQRNGLFPTGGIAAASDYLASVAPLAAAFPGATGLDMRFATDHGASFDIDNNAGNGLVVGGNLLAVSVPLDEAINDFRMSRTFNVGNQRHDVAFGVYVANYEFRFDRYMATSLLEVADQARRLDILAVDAAGNTVGSITDNGILRYGSLYNKSGGDSRTYAFYASDEWQVTPQLRIDAGVRHEETELSGSVEGTTTVDLGVASTLADNQFITGSGVFTPIDREYSETAWTVGATWLARDNMNVFARYTDTFRTPNGTDFVGNPTRTDIGVEPIRMAEIGLNWETEPFDLYATTFYTHFEGVRFTDFVFDPATNGYTQRSTVADTKTWGLELEGIYRPVEWFDIAGAVTWQNAEYDGFVFTEIVGGNPVERDFSGNQLIRVPELGGRIVPGVNLMQDRLRAELEIEYYSDRYADVANQVELPSYVALNANARFDVTDALSLQFNATNLTNEIGLTEGNPRAGQFISGDAGAEFYLARPILGRTFRVAATYRF